ncbi:MAG: hypothetical protein HQK79_08925 [Desulfobacterales bacterium]|nr:hypothetical protein [Desulfobacterales bacterium]MBF0398852.1 hypothetical protein [Desulfobacterales bacterium]
MKKERQKKEVELDDQIGCFGEFNLKSSVCTKLCALSLRCIVEENNYNDIENIYDMLTYGDIMTKVQ